MKRSHLRSQSATRRRGHDARVTAIELAVARVGDRCELEGYGSCWHPRGERLDPHESPRQSQLAGARFVSEIIVILCRAHHDLEDSDPLLAEFLGIRIPPNVYRAYPRKAVLQSRALRIVASSTGVASIDGPYWVRDDWAGVDADRLECDARGDSIDPLDPFATL